MTPIERSLGRFMRAPDGHEGGDGGDASGGDGDGGSDGASSNDGSADEGDGTSVLGGAEAAAEDGAGDGGKDGEAADGDEGAADGEDDEAAKAEDDTVPETYELKLTTKDEEGKDVEVEIDQALLTKATPILKELNITNAQANKLAPVVMDIQSQLLKGQAESFDAMKTQWAKDAQADEEIGGKNWTPSLNLAAKALDHLGYPKGSAFRGLLDETGLGNHPEMIRAFRKIGTMLAEDTKLEGGDRNPKGKKDKLETMYPDDVPQKQS